MHGWSSTRRASLSNSCTGTRVLPIGDTYDGADLSAPTAFRADVYEPPFTTLRKRWGMAIHKVRFQPVGIEIEVNEDETVLNAAFRQGVSLTHGCREGQCSACKSFLLDGDIEMEKYSTFALPEYESDEGYVLLCRCHAYSDLEVELINYDEDILRLGIPIESYQMTIEAIEALSHDIKRLVLKFNEPERRLKFCAGQYASIRIPGSGEYLAYSMANNP